MTASSNYYRIYANLLLLGLVAASGCGDGRPARTPVSGVVLFDSQPVSDATVVLMTTAGGRPATGVTDKEGKFTLTTFDQEDGAFLGEHVVTVIKKELQITGTAPVKSNDEGRNAVSTPVLGYNSNVKWYLPKKYADPSTSALRIKVEPGMEPVRLELKSD